MSDPNKPSNDDLIGDLMETLSEEVAEFSDPAAQPPSVQQTYPLTKEDGRLAMELASGLREEKDIARTYGLTLHQLRTKKKDRLFQAALGEAKKLWSADSSLKDRVKTKAGFLVEDMLLYMYELSQKPETPVAVKHDIFKSFTTLAAVKESAGEGDLSSKFSVTIVLDPLQREKNVTIEGKTNASDALADTD